MSNKKESKLSNYDKHKENPFLKEAVEQIQHNIVKKYKSTGGTSQSAILQAVNSDGELVGHTSFIRQIEVDEEQFTKIYLAQFSSFWNLKTQAIRVFGYIMTKLIPRQDTFMFFLDECMEYTGYKGKNSIYIGLTSLVENNIIARGRNDSHYFINPMVAFNGDRVTFAKTYIKKQSNKIKQVDPAQTNILDAIAEVEQA